jgi:hypothetical protein
MIALACAIVYNLENIYCNVVASSSVNGIIVCILTEGVEWI